MQLKVDMRIRHVVDLFEARTCEESVHPLLDVRDFVKLGQATVLCGARQISRVDSF
jgi:hypothetical protein